MVIKIIVTSTRPLRNGGHIAEAIAPLLAEASGKQVELVDLREVALPLLDEPEMPRMGNYQNEHTKAWAKTISDAEAVVWVTPEYNGFFTAAAKNAIDTLGPEWAEKPTAIVGYGFGGGGRAVPPLTQLLENVGAKVVQGSVLLSFQEFMGESGLDAAGLVAAHADELRALGAQLA
ncbi:NADPH-dependent FMN reductase [Tessaracoccus sp. OH4464_COT-324]|uniref:NADPH-dependent FMN reductase n=1 Tax=Tessaracoccus sp. OH4464_COT-324 TaxID=2491059 RepID=UPI000F63ECF3|nr:NAD(P)H-dependent oxidoreductase [Tessaracoccus sp. OH4464_COT-324]RRD47179.1 NADPH-dependent oxidoreductase [Tessaracoccus sp. OH4464_COT-324]